MRTLRAPDGCPWDREQTLSSLRPFVLEEAYEVLDAIDRADANALCDEPGRSRLRGSVSRPAVCRERTVHDRRRAQVGGRQVGASAIRHVFGDRDTRGSVKTAEDVKRRWEAIKASEQEAAGRQPSLLGSIPAALPALLRAYRIGKRVATVGFDWERPDQVLKKVDEELIELREAIDDEATDRIGEELGDLLFALANLARHLGIEPEGALAHAQPEVLTTVHRARAALSGAAHTAQRCTGGRDGA